MQSVRTKYMSLIIGNNINRISSIDIVFSFVKFQLISSAKFSASPTLFAYYVAAKTFNVEQFESGTDQLLS